MSKKTLEKELRFRWVRASERLPPVKLAPVGPRGEMRPVPQRYLCAVAYADYQLCVHLSLVATFKLKKPLEDALDEWRSCMTTAKEWAQTASPEDQAAMWSKVPPVDWAAHELPESYEFDCWESQGDAEYVDLQGVGTDVLFWSEIPDPPGLWDVIRELRQQM